MNLTPLPHWTQHTGPSNWYRVWFPPAWRLDTNAGTVQLAAPDEGGVLTISSFWIDDPQADSAEKLINLDRLFPRRRRVRPLKSAAARVAEQAPPGSPPNPAGGGMHPPPPDETLAFEGEVLLGGETRWWKRLWGALHVFRRSRWRRWRMWVFRRGPVCVLALYLQSIRPDREAETVAGMIVNSLDIPERPACPPEVFARRVLELARRKFPLLDCQPAPDFQIKLGESKLNLFNFYRSYTNSPDQFEALILPALTTVVQVQGWGPEQIEPPLDWVRERIMPMLYPEELWQQQFPNFVGLPWVGGLVVLYVVDESQAYWYIRDDLLETWKISADDLHELAVENLNRYFDSRPMEFTVAGEEDGPRLLIPSRQDAYNTARLLSRPFREKLRKILGSEFVVGAPGRDFFVAVSLDSTETIDSIRQKVEDDFEQMDHPLSDRLLVVTHDGVAEFAPWCGGDGAEPTNSGDV